MKKQGLVTKKETRQSTAWTLKKLGKHTLSAYHRLRTDPFSSRHIAFPKPKGGGLTIVSFDISEKERRKRDWIRRCLVEMDFKMLQKSVWAAHGGVHEDFIHALRERKLLDAVHIFSVTR
ncbi:MAG: hypothetical protein Greene071436_72 [Parcubacteria group bacterium Greene0714_36]|nr:MAG: hypothetical protein Greene071436_72 [Parcubacteria group bacterium Greene0714_36]